MTRASRDTTTGLWFEEQIHINNKGIDLTKNKLYTYLKSRGIDYTTIINDNIGNFPLDSVNIRTVGNSNIPYSNIMSI